MSTKTTTIIALILIALAVLAGAVLWNQLPDQMASHWNVNDEVDGTMPKFWGVFLMPLITLGMLALFIVLPGLIRSRRILHNFVRASICLLC